MPRFEIKVTRRPNIESPAFNEQQMREIGQAAIDVMKERLATATDVFDKPAPPLQKGYAKQKAKKGKQPIRDIRLTGNTLGSVQVTEADSAHVKIKIRGVTPYKKAIFNQNIDPWFGLSEKDDERLLEETVRPIFAQNIQDALK